MSVRDIIGVMCQSKGGNLVTSFGSVGSKEDHFKFYPTRLAVDADCFICL